MSNFDHEALNAIAEQAKRLLDGQTTPEHLKQLLDVPGGFDRSLWTAVTEQGWTAIAAPEAMGGLGLGWRGLGVLCDALGGMSASLPLIANVLLAHALASAQTASERDLAQRLVAGKAIACLALADPQDAGLNASSQAIVSDGRLTGCKALAAFAAVADVALVQARDASGVGLFWVDLTQAGVQRAACNTLDNARAMAQLHFEGVPVHHLTGRDHLDGKAQSRELVDLAALLTCFEQVGGTRACLDMACAYALERRAFGHPIGTFQGVKHALANVYCLQEIAQGCLDDALAACEQNVAGAAPLIAAARIAATQAYTAAAEQNLHVHGGMGVTWEAMPHHFYRRARSLALELGALPFWRERLLSNLGLESTHALAGFHP